LAGDDLLVVAGDNLFDFSLADFRRFWAARGKSSALAICDFPDLDLVRGYSTVELDTDDRITSFTEKPTVPKSGRVGTATYIFHRDHAAMLDTYLGEGQSPDQPGHFIAWLHRRRDVYGYRFSGHWLDIGNEHELLRADNLLRRRQGWPDRAEYSIE
jgi:glucose-1-phosphate thymidylyltransferase